MRIILSVFFLVSFTSFSQLLSGTLMDEGRKLISEIKYVQEGNVDGWVIYELAVNREGNVTGLTIIESTIKSTPAKVDVRNYLAGMKFEKGTHYPQFHHVRVKITVVKPK
jgi:hypothetical protein